MLSRVANSLYWMTRYIERAENIARIVDVNLQLLLDFRSLDDERLAALLDAHRAEHRRRGDFFELYDEANGQTVTEFLVFQQENPNSIVSSIALARENARMVRDQITIEMWEEINRIYLFAPLPAGAAICGMAARAIFSMRSAPPRCHLRGSRMPPSRMTKAGISCNWGNTSSAPTKPRASSTCATRPCRRGACPRW